jgi:hypothetical protein
VLTIGSSTSLAYQLKLPVTNHLSQNGRALSREKFYVPGSVLAVKLNTDDPINWGEPDAVDVMFTTNDPAFDLAADATSAGLGRVAWYDSKTPLRSGWAWGQEHLEGGVAIARAKVGKGTLILYGPEVLFRGQPHGTFKLLFNGIFEAAGREP